MWFSSKHHRSKEYSRVLSLARCGKSSTERGFRPVSETKTTRGNTFRPLSDRLVEVFGIPGTLHGDLRGGGVDIAEIVRRELDGTCAEVLAQALEPPGAGMGTIHGL